MYRTQEQGLVETTNVADYDTRKGDNFRHYDYSANWDDTRLVGVFKNPQFEGRKGHGRWEHKPPLRGNIYVDDTKTFLQKELNFANAQLQDLAAHKRGPVTPPKHSNRLTRKEARAMERQVRARKEKEEREIQARIQRERSTKRQEEESFFDNRDRRKAEADKKEAEKWNNYTPRSMKFDDGNGPQRIPEMSCEQIMRGFGAR